MKDSREIKIGIVFAAGIIILIWGMNFLKGKDFFVQKRNFYAVYNQVNGLVVSNPVFINGMRVGKIDDISFMPDRTGRLVVKMTIDSDFEIPSNSIARIYSSDLMGTKAIELKVGDSKTSAESGDTLASSIQGSLQDEVNVQLLPLKRKAEDLMLSFDSVLSVVQYIFNEKTRNNITTSFESIKVTIKNLQNITYNVDTLLGTQRVRLSSIIKNVESISSNLKDNGPKLTNIINNFSTLSDSLAKSDIARVIGNTDKTMKEASDIVDKINKGQGSLGLLVNNDSLYKKLNASSTEIELLIKDIKENPSRYIHISVFGGGKEKKKK